MWLKLAGAIFIIGACSVMGFQTARRYGQRPRQIRQLISCISALHSYIYFSSMPLNEALRHCAEGVEGVIAAMFRHVGHLLAADAALTPAEAFCQAQSEYTRELSLDVPEQELLALLCSHLGMMNRDEQAKNLVLIQEQLERIACEAAAIRDGNMKMYQYLGVCGGFAIVILLL